MDTLRAEADREHRIRIGNQTSFSAPSILAPFEYAVKSGFDAFEWFPDKRESGEGWTEADLTLETCTRIRKTASEHDISLSVHAPWHADPRDPRKADLLDRQVDFALRIGATLLNVHAYLCDGAATYVRGIAPLRERLVGTGIRLSIENTPLDGPEAFNALFGLLDANEESDAVGMCLDLGHANLCGATRNDYLSFVDRLDPHLEIIHVHLHENYGDSDTHLPLFTGPAGKDPSGITGFIERLEKRRYAGALILEQWPEPPELLNQARDRLLPLLNQSSRPFPSRDLPLGKEALFRVPPLEKRDEGRIGAPSHEEPGRDGTHPLPQTEAQLDDFTSLIVKGDAENRSWREKLAFVYDILTDDSIDLDPGKLATLAVYLRFVGTGEIPSLEEGGHHRPSHHARTAERIHDRLTGLTSPENILILRRIYPWLPSFKSAFTSAEPLTRIRDIAHRNDIPHEVKEEIKHTLQNKLHRNAGPEDLKTSQALLERFTTPGAGYPVAFVEEFKKFHEELREFFNARSLERDLEALVREGGLEAGLVEEFLHAKGKEGAREELVKTLELLTTLRSVLARGTKEKGPKAQELLIADIRLEDFSFVLLSRLAGSIDLSGGDPKWIAGIQCLSLSLAGLRLSGLEPEESLAAERELRAISRDFTPQSTDRLLRLKAAVERALRLPAAYCDRILFLFPDRAEALGSALGVPRKAVKVYAEAEIRRHLVFQVSKIGSVFLKEIRKKAGLPPWSRIVPGEASGLLKRAVHMSALGREAEERSVVALIERAEGEEEIPAGLVGIVTAREVPHLSHLAVRARQRNVVFLICEDRDLFEEIGRMSGKRVRVDASGETVSVKEIRSNGKTERLKSARKSGRTAPLRVSRTSLSSHRRWVSLQDVTLENGGSKSLGAKRLEEMTKEEGAGFETPAGLVIPFGVMEEALRSNPAGHREYLSLARSTNGLPDEAFEEAVKGLRGWVSALEVPQEVLSGIRARFAPGRPVMVRSSSNCEDLEAFSAAGLYESAPAWSPSQTIAAVKRVWASLWTMRAALGRRYAGIPQEEARMAVLIQEMIIPEYAFILHTHNPVSQSPGEVYMELAVGLGETLASGRMPGTPYRMVYDKGTRRSRTLSFAGFSRALWPDSQNGVVEKTVDYSESRLTGDDDFRMRLGSRLGAVGEDVEKAVGMPQDMEGVFSGGTIYLVQTRPQQGLQDG